MELLNNGFDPTRNFGIFGHHDRFDRAVANNNLVDGSYDELESKDDDDDVSLGSDEGWEGMVMMCLGGRMMRK